MTEDAAAPLPPATVEQLVDRLASGEGEAAEAPIMPLVYEELRRLARSYVRRERARSVQQPVVKAPRCIESGEAPA